MKLSILCSAYNRPKLLERLLKSLDAQTDQRFEFLIADDNSVWEVNRLAREFLNRHAGLYARSNVKEEDRIKKCRYSVAVNELLTYATGDVVVCLADDHEFTPKVVEAVLGFFENSPAGAGYVGIGYRIADFRTGALVDPATILDPDRSRWLIEQGGVIRKNYPGHVGYGGVIEHPFTVLDCVQFFYRRDYAVEWNEADWMGADATAMEQIAQMVGGVHPIGDVYEVMVYSNLNEGSLTIQGSPEASIEVLRA